MKCLTGSGPRDLLFRLFHELDVRVQPFRPLRDECRCSPERVERMLATLSMKKKLAFR